MPCSFSVGLPWENPPAYPHTPGTGAWETLLGDISLARAPSSLQTHPSRSFFIFACTAVSLLSLSILLSLLCAPLSPPLLRHHNIPRSP